jgi:hypothetical protein
VATTAFCCGSIRSSVPVEVTHPAPSVTAIRLRRGASALLRLGKARARWTRRSPQVIRPRGSVRRTRRPDEPSVGHRSQGRGNRDALVFTAPFGGPLHLTNFRSRVWVRRDRNRSVRAGIWPAPILPRGSPSRSGPSCGRQRGFGRHESDSRIEDRLDDSVSAAGPMRGHGRPDRPSSDPEEVLNCGFSCAPGPNQTKGTKAVRRARPHRSDVSIEATYRLGG